MRYLLVTLILLFSFSGCENKKQLNQEEQAQHDAQIAQRVRAEVVAELEAKKLQEKVLQAQKLPEETLQKTHILEKEGNQTADTKSAKLSELGIHIEKDSITIDTNKTKAFFNDLSKKFDVQMKKISDDLEKGIIETKEAGVEINDQHIHIDLNKTQNMLEDWGKKIQIFVEEFDELSNHIDNNNTN